MKRVLMCSLFATAVIFAACGDSDENNATNTATNNDTSGTTGSNNGTGGTNNETNSSIPMAGDCGWGDFIATCGGGPERDISARAVGCREYYAPTPADQVSQEALCDGELWDEMATCSDSGLSGRRPLGCCFQLDPETQFHTRNCFYDDPAAVEASAGIAQGACEDAGFCWIPAEMM